MPTTIISARVAYASLCVCALVCKIALGFIIFEQQHVKLDGQVALDRSNKKTREILCEKISEKYKVHPRELSSLGHTRDVWHRVGARLYKYQHA